MQLDNDNMSRAGSGIGVLVRSEKPAQVFDSIRQINRQISNQQVVFSPQTMNEIIAISLADRRFSMILLGLFAALALLLSSVGIYGVVSYIVSQRTREIGIRVALGAQHADILGFVLRQAAKMALIGVLLGLAFSVALTHLLSALLFHVTPTDLLTLAAVVSLLLTVTFTACLLPARRAASIDPLLAIRHE
jgi:ABC-type antimicrobial peptide transport system permease subunit